MDRLIDLIGTVQPGIIPNYNKHHIGLSHNGITKNFVIFNPRKSYVLTQFRIPQDQEEELNTLLVEEGLSIVPYDTRYGYYRVRISPNDIDSRKLVIKELITKAHNAHFG